MKSLWLKIKVLFWLNVIAFVGFTVFAVGATGYYFFKERSAANYYKKRLVHDFAFNKAWVTPHLDRRADYSCKLKGHPVGYRCLYKETEKEMVRRPLTLIGVADLWGRGLWLIYRGDKELARQAAVVGGPPDERRKLEQAKHWSQMISNVAKNSLRQAPIWSAVHYVTGIQLMSPENRALRTVSVEKKAQRKKKSANFKVEGNSMIGWASKKSPSAKGKKSGSSNTRGSVAADDEPYIPTSIDELDLDKIKKSIQRHNDKIKGLNDMMSDL